MGHSIARRAGVLRRVRLPLIIGGVWLAWTSSAWANLPPGPLRGIVPLADILILPLMMLLTALGGGYSVMRAAGIKFRWWLIWLAVAAIVLIGINPAASASLAAFFGLYALVRGIRLAVWGAKGLRPPEKRAPHVAHASPARLLSAGLLTCLTAVPVVGLGFAFANWWPFDVYAEQELKQVVAYELVRGRDHRDARGQPQYEAPHPYRPQATDSSLAVGGMHLLYLRYKEASRAGGGYFAAEFRLGPGARSFQVWAWPERTPFFPYNYLVTLPSFYADQTGQLRMIRVHKPGELCPPDAPVYYQVRPEEAQIPP